MCLFEGSQTLKTTDLGIQFIPSSGPEPERWTAKFSLRDSPGFMPKGLIVHPIWSFLHAASPRQESWEIGLLTRGCPFCAGEMNGCSANGDALEGVDAMMILQRKLAALLKEANDPELRTLLQRAWLLGPRRIGPNILSSSAPGVPT